MPSSKDMGQHGDEVVRVADAPSPLRMMPADKGDTVECVALVPRLILQRDVHREASKVIGGAQTGSKLRDEHRDLVQLLK